MEHFVHLERAELAKFFVPGDCAQGQLLSVELETRPEMELRLYDHFDCLAQAIRQVFDAESGRLIFVEQAECFLGPLHKHITEHVRAEDCERVHGPVPVCELYETQVLVSIPAVQHLNFGGLAFGRWNT